VRAILHASRQFDFGIYESVSEQSLPTKTPHDVIDRRQPTATIEQWNPWCQEGYRGKQAGSGTVRVSSCSTTTPSEKPLWLLGFFAAHPRLLHKNPAGRSEDCTESNIDGYRVRSSSSRTSGSKRPESSSPTRALAPSQRNGPLSASLFSNPKRRANRDGSGETWRYREDDE
jgi:hypothetical protein